MPKPSPARPARSATPESPAADAPPWQAGDAQLQQLWAGLHAQCSRSAAAHWPAFDQRLRRHLPTLRDELRQLYGQRADFAHFMADLLAQAFAAWCSRAPALQALDLQREFDSRWFQAPTMLGAVCYVDLFAGHFAGIENSIPYFQELGVTYLHLMPPYKCPQPHSDGGYAVSSYRATNPGLGSIDGLRQLATALRAAGISLVLDFVFNHTADDHAWARAAAAGDPQHRDFYFIYPDRTEPDRYERTLREIFPDEHPGAFSQLPDGRWVWTTFHAYQWDLNYGNPAVFTAMAGEMLFIANLGVEFLRMDAVAFIWKQLGTACENLAQAHTLLRAYNALARIAAPALLFKSEAIVHPDEVLRYIAPAECQVSYNPLQMALLWNSLATRQVNLLQQALDHRHALPDGTAWVNYVRSHDDIGWTFADEDAAAFGIQGFDHRNFLNRYYVNRFPGSFARGVPFQENPVTGDSRISGTTASLCGLEQADPHAVARVLLLYGVTLATGGILLLYLGDEIGQLNDAAYLQDPGKAGDSRWVHRLQRRMLRPAACDDTGTDTGRIFQGLLLQLRTRRVNAAFGGGRLIGFDTRNPGVLGFTRPHAGGDVLVLANFSEFTQTVQQQVLSGLPPAATDLLTQARVPLRAGLALAPYQLLWLHCHPGHAC